jgi:hypothetical protein
MWIERKHQNLAARSRERPGALHQLDVPQVDAVKVAYCDSDCLGH